MDITELHEGGAVVLALSGRLDSATHKAVDDKLAGALVGPGATVIDLSGVDYISSAGLRVLLKAAKQAKSASNRLALAGVRPAVKEVFDISGFTALFQIYPDRAAAVAAAG